MKSSKKRVYLSVKETFDIIKEEKYSECGHDMLQIINEGGQAEAFPWLNCAKYEIDLKKHFKIWFHNGKSDSFMPVKNQLRLVKMRNQYKDIEIFLVYSSLLLNEAGKSSLQKFCKQHKIQAVDFDESAHLLCDDNHGFYDEELYDLVKKEIESYKDGMGGNLAAASDMLRMMVGALSNLGIYSDFDCVLDIKDKMYTVKYPIIFRSEVSAEPCVSTNEQEKFQAFLLSVNNDIIAVSSKNGKLHEDASKIIEKIQTEILRRSKDFGHHVIEDDKLLRETLMKIKKENKISDIDALRKICSNNPSEHFNVFACKIMLMKSVMNVTGPDMLFDVIFSEKDNAVNLLKIADEFEQFIGKGARRIPNDLSWLKSGEDSMIQHDQKIVKAAETIQKYYRSYAAQNRSSSSNVRDRAI